VLPQEIVWEKRHRKVDLERNIELLAFCLEPKLKTPMILHLRTNTKNINSRINFLIQKGFLEAIAPAAQSKGTLYHTTLTGKILLMHWNKLVEALTEN
jgi:predicted transcriptional regulator